MASSWRVRSLAGGLAAALALGPCSAPAQEQFNANPGGGSGDEYGAPGGRQYGNPVRPRLGDAAIPPRLAEDLRTGRCWHDPRPGAPTLIQCAPIQPTLCEPQHGGPGSPYVYRTERTCVATRPPEPFPFQRQVPQTDYRAGTSTTVLQGSAAIDNWCAQWDAQWKRLTGIEIARFNHEARLFAARIRVAPGVASYGVNVVEACRFDVTVLRDGRIGAVDLADSTATDPSLSGCSILLAQLKSARTPPFPASSPLGSVHLRPTLSIANQRPAFYGSVECRRAFGA